MCQGVGMNMSPPVNQLGSGNVNSQPPQGGSDNQDIPPQFQMTGAPGSGLSG